MKEGNVAGGLRFVLLLTHRHEVCETNGIEGVNTKGEVPEGTPPL
jgi:hypothetical protein